MRKSPSSLFLTAPWQRRGDALLTSVLCDSPELTVRLLARLLPPARLSLHLRRASVRVLMSLSARLPAARHFHTSSNQPPSPSPPPISPPPTDCVYLVFCYTYKNTAVCLLRLTWVHHLNAGGRATMPAIRLLPSSAQIWKHLFRLVRSLAQPRSPIANSGVWRRYRADCLRCL